MDAVGLGSSIGFLGEYTPRLDDKGRLILPARYRGAFAAGLVMTRGQERCLYVYPLEEFRRRYDLMRDASFGQKANRDFLRMFLSSAHDEMPDKQGRVSIPAPLRAYAGLDRDVAVVGVGNHVEIWDGPAWTAYVADSIDSYAASSDDLSPA